jgi:hypothetical protein
VVAKFPGPTPVLFSRPADSRHRADYKLKLSTDFFAFKRSSSSAIGLHVRWAVTRPKQVI